MKFRDLCNVLFIKISTVGPSHISILLKYIVKFVKIQIEGMYIMITHLIYYPQ